MNQGKQIVHQTIKWAMTSARKIG